MFYNQDSIKNNPDFYVMENMFNPNMTSPMYLHNTNAQRGFGVSHSNERALFDPNHVEGRTGLPHTQGVYNPESMYNAIGMLNSDAKNAAGWIDSLDDAGFSLYGENGVEHKVRPETVRALKATRPLYNDNLFGRNTDQFKSQVTDNYSKMYNDQGFVDAIGGMTKLNDTIMQDHNAIYQNALYLMNSGDPYKINQGKQMMQALANSQYVFNTAQPEVSKAIQGRVNGIKNFAKNNWWWMLPAGGALLYGVSNMFGQNRNPNNQKTMRPEGWHSDIVEQPQSQAQNLKPEQGLEDEEY